MAYYLLNNPTGNSDNTLKTHADIGICCGEAETVQVYSNTATNLSTSAVTKIVIDGTEYTFTTPASTLALLKAGVDEAMAAAGYQDLDSVGVATSGSATAAVVSITTTATLTKLVNAAAADIALTAA